MAASCTTDFDDWLVETFAKVGAFTMLIVLVEIGETSIALLASSYLHAIGNETRWADMVDLLSRANVPWNGAAFFRGDRGGLIDDATASAIRKLQSDQGIARTGFPDHETVRRLGLDPDRLFRRSARTSTGRR